MGKNDVIINGIRLGTHNLDPDKVIDQINEKCIAHGMNYVNISTYGGEFDVREDIKQSQYVEWAEYCAKNKVYFSINGGGDRRHAGFTEETAKKMKEVAGEYFIAYQLGELGSAYSCKGSGYASAPTKPWNDLQDAKDAFVNKVKEHVEENKMGCDLPTTVIESTSMVIYEGEGGVTFPTMEFWPGDMEISAAFTRGTATAYNSRMWAVYFAHEWYAGLRHDELKKKRLKMGYDYCYMGGGNAFLLESGDENIYTFGVNAGYDEPLPKHYRKVIRDFAKFAKEDGRPAGGPKVRVAFVYGNLEGYSFRHSGGSLWRGHMQKEYGYGEIERTWRILDNIRSKRSWADVHNYTDDSGLDLSGAPAYGLYDVIPATAGADVFSKYDYLIFVGWNTMTDEIYENLKKFVENGGRLFMTAAHLNTSKKRDGSISLIKGGNVSDLFGCNLDAENVICQENGCNIEESIVPEFKYCVSRITFSDPYFAEGYVNYAKTTLTTGKATARISDRFAEPEPEKCPISLVENKCGDGYAILMTNLEYPSGAGFPTYQTFVREILTASHRTADIKVYGPTALRFAVYEGDKVYLLNTDFDSKISATIDYGTHKVEFLLDPCEFKAVEKQ